LLWLVRSATIHTLVQQFVIQWKYLTIVEKVRCPVELAISCTASNQKTLGSLVSLYVGLFCFYTMLTKLSLSIPRFENERERVQVFMLYYTLFFLLVRALLLLFFLYYYVFLLFFSFSFDCIFHFEEEKKIIIIFFFLTLRLYYDITMRFFNSLYFITDFFKIIFYVF